MESTTPMDAAEVLVLGEVDRLGLSEEDPMVYVHSSTAQYKVIQTACQFQVQHPGYECSTYPPSLAWLSEGYPKWLDITAGEILYMELENSVATRQIYGGLTETPSGIEILIIISFFIQVRFAMRPISSSTTRVLRAVSLLYLIN